MKINLRILAGFSFIIVLILALVFFNSTLNNQRLANTNEIKDVESPLDLMVEKVISYDAMLTGAANSALIHAQKGQLTEVQEDTDYYNEVGSKLDNLLKIEAPSLLAKSKRSQETKDNVTQILKQLDEINLVLVDMETRTFEAIEKNNTDLAREIMVSEDYEQNKIKLLELYNQWSAIESKVTSDLRLKIIDQSLQLNRLNLYFSIIIICLAIILSFLISRSISKPIRNLKNNVDEISKGKLDIQLEKSSLFEVQSLTDSLNRILATMKLAILRTGLSKGELGLGETIRAKEEAEDRYKLLYENSSNAIMTLEPPNWNFTSGNPATLKIFGLKNEKELQALNPGDLSPKTQPDGNLSSIKAKKMIEKAIKEGSVRFDWVHKKYKGENFSAEVRLDKMKLNGKDILQATIRQIEENLSHKNKK